MKNGWKGKREKGRSENQRTRRSVNDCKVYDRPSYELFDFALRVVLPECHLHSFQFQTRCGWPTEKQIQPPNQSNSTTHTPNARLYKHAYNPPRTHTHCEYQFHSAVVALMSDPIPPPVPSYPAAYAAEAEAEANATNLTPMSGPPNPPSSEPSVPPSPSISTVHFHHGSSSSIGAVPPSPNSTSTSNSTPHHRHHPSNASGGSSIDFDQSGGASQTGWLLKLGGQVKKFKRRFFRLHGTRLEYYKDDNPATRRLGVIPLIGATLVVFDKSIYGESACFGITPAQSKRTFCLRGANDADMQKWLTWLRPQVQKRLQDKGFFQRNKHYPGSIREGILEQQRSSDKEKWSERFLVLGHQNGQPSLVAYKEVESTKPAGEIVLDSTCVVASEDAVTESPFAFSVTSSAGGGGGKKMIFRVGDSDEKSDWIRAIQDVISGSTTVTPVAGSSETTTSASHQRTGSHSDVPSPSATTGGEIKTILSKGDNGFQYSESESDAMSEDLSLDSDSEDEESVDALTDRLASGGTIRRPLPPLPAVPESHDQAPRPTPTSTSPPTTAASSSAASVAGASSSSTTLASATKDFDLLSNRVVKESFLKKLGAKVKSWKTRYFKLVGYVLTYSESRDTPVLGEIDLIGTLVKAEPDALFGMPFTFSITQTQAGTRTYYIVASDRHEMEEWVALLKQRHAFTPNGLPLRLNPRVHISMNLNPDDAALRAIAVNSSQPINSSYISTDADRKENSKSTLKGAVSKKKRRFVMDGFDLDLCLAYGTLVARHTATPAGPKSLAHVRVEELSLGDALVASDGSVTRVIGAVHSDASAMIRVEYEHGAHTVTPFHLVTLRWMRHPTVHVERTNSDAIGVTLEWRDRHTLQRHSKHWHLSSARFARDSDLASNFALWWLARAERTGVDDVAPLRFGDLVDVHAVELMKLLRCDATLLDALTIPLHRMDGAEEKPLTAQQRESAGRATLVEAGKCGLASVQHDSSSVADSDADLARFEIETNAFVSPSPNPSESPTSDVIYMLSSDVDSRRSRQMLEQAWSRVMPDGARLEDTTVLVGAIDLATMTRALARQPRAIVVFGDDGRRQWLEYGAALPMVRDLRPTWSNTDINDLSLLVTAHDGTSTSIHFARDLTHAYHLDSVLAAILAAHRSRSLSSSFSPSPSASSHVAECLTANAGNHSRLVRLAPAPSSPFMKIMVDAEDERFVLSDGAITHNTYITNRIIAMGFPADGTESIYRNDMVDVQRFFETRHKDHYKVYNLCSERKYEHSKFHNRVLAFPFDDHNVPYFQDLPFFCKDVADFLSEHEKNVACIHCKAGKGRTGLLITCFLVYCGEWSTADEALRFYAFARTQNQKGVTIASQIRWVHYWEKYLSLSRDGIGLPKLEALAVKKMVFSKKSPSWDFFVASCHGEIVSSKDQKVKEIKGKDGAMELDFTAGHASQLSESPWVFLKDFQFEFFKGKLFGGSARVMSFWLHTQFLALEPNYYIKLDRMDIDKVSKTKGIPDFTLEIWFEPVTTGRKALEALAPENAASMTHSSLDHNPSLPTIPSSMSVENRDMIEASLTMMLEGRKMTRFYLGNKELKEKEVEKKEVFLFLKDETGKEGSNDSASSSSSSSAKSYTLYWCLDSQSLSNASSGSTGYEKIRLNDIATILVGKQNDIWSRNISTKQAIEDRCFSIISKTGAELHVEAYSERQLSLWVEGFKFLLTQLGTGQTLREEEGEAFQQSLLALTAGKAASAAVAPAAAASSSTDAPSRGRAESFARPPPLKVPENKHRRIISVTK